MVADKWAGQTGIQIGDEIVAVNGASVDTLTADTFQQAMQDRPAGPAGQAGTAWPAKQLATRPGNTAEPHRNKQRKP